MVGPSGNFYLRVGNASVSDPAFPHLPLLFQGGKAITRVLHMNITRVHYCCQCSNADTRRIALLAAKGWSSHT